MSPMKGQVEELNGQAGKLIAEAAECDLIASLATDNDKRRTFRSLADQYRVADTVRKTLADREAKEGRLVFGPLFGSWGVNPHHRPARGIHR